LQWRRGSRVLAAHATRATCVAHGRDTADLTGTSGDAAGADAGTEVLSSDVSVSGAAIDVVRLGPPVRKISRSSSGSCR
jgi:hypothetical protein